MPVTVGAAPAAEGAETMTRTAPGLLLVLLCGCGDGDGAESPDLSASPPDLTAPVDLVVRRDLTVPPDLTRLPDLVVAVDLAVPDLAVPPDLAVALPDLVEVLDLAVPVDLLPPPDLRPPHDLSHGPDMTVPEDLVVVPTTWDVTVGFKGALAFSPATVNIAVGDTVRWTWAASGHNVVSGMGGVADNNFCSPSDMNCAGAKTSLVNFVYTHTFAAAGAFPYFCAPHAGAGMTGTVNVN